MLGARKDPFEPAPVKQPKKAKTADAKADDTTTAPSSGAGRPRRAAGRPGRHAQAQADGLSGRLARDPLRRRRGRHAAQDGPAQAEAAARRRDRQLLVYLGLTKNGKKAKFLVDDALEVTGDGTCKPHPSNCETIELAAGETEFFDVLDPETGDIVASFELDLVKINR